MHDQNHVVGLSPRRTEEPPHAGAVGRVAASPHHFYWVVRQLGIRQKERGEGQEALDKGVIEGVCCAGGGAGVAGGEGVEAGANLLPVAIGRAVCGRGGDPCRRRAKAGSTAKRVGCVSQHASIIRKAPPQLYACSSLRSLLGGGEGGDGGRGGMGGLQSAAARVFSSERRFSDCSQKKGSRTCL